MLAKSVLLLAKDWPKTLVGVQVSKSKDSTADISSAWIKNFNLQGILKCTEISDS